MHASIRAAFAVAWLSALAPCAWSETERRPGHNSTTFAVSGELKLEYFDKKTVDRAGKIGRDTDALIDEAVLTLDGSFPAFPDVTLVLATEKIRTAEFEPAFVKELFVTHRFDPNHKLVAGRMELPFGNFRTATLTDPQTKKIGKAKTDAGLGVKGKRDAGRLEWNVIAFADDYRTPTPGANGVTANLSWNPTDRWTVGAGILSSQYARTHTPALANFHVGARVGTWGLTGEYVTALDDSGGERPYGVSVDASFGVTSQISLGVRVQSAARRFAADGVRVNYNEWAVAAKYAPAPTLTLGIEYLNGTQRDRSVTVEKTKQVTAQVIYLF